MRLVTQLRHWEDVEDRYGVHTYHPAPVRIGNRPRRDFRSLPRMRPHLHIGHLFWIAALLAFVLERMFWISTLVISPFDPYWIHGFGFRMQGVRVSSTDLQALRQGTSLTDSSGTVVIDPGHDTIRVLDILEDGTLVLDGAITSRALEGLCPGNDEKPVVIVRTHDNASYQHFISGMEALDRIRWEECKYWLFLGDSDPPTPNDTAGPDSSRPPPNGG